MDWSLILLPSGRAFHLKYSQGLCKLSSVLVFSDSVFHKSSCKACIHLQLCFPVLQAKAPHNVVFEDVEEEFQIDAEGNGSWQPVERKAAPVVKLNLKGEPSSKPRKKKAPKNAPMDMEEL